MAGSWSCSLQVSRVIWNHFIFSFLLSEGFGHLSSLKDLDLSYCVSLDQVATLQLIIEKFQGLTKLALRGWKITDLTEGGLFLYYILFFIPDVQRLRASGQPDGPQHEVLRQCHIAPCE